MSDPTRRAWRFYLDDMIAFEEKVIVDTQDLDQATGSSPEYHFAGTGNMIERGNCE